MYQTTQTIMSPRIPPHTSSPTDSLSFFLMSRAGDARCVVDQ